MENKIKNDDSKKWKRKRLASTLVGIAYNFVFGLEYTSILISLLYYLKEYFNPNTANFLYGIIVMISMLPGFLAGAIGKIVDKTGNLKQWMCLLLLIVILGNLMYVVYFSIWFLIIGRFLTGVSVGLRSCIAGEFAKWYDDPQMVLFYYQMAFSTGLTIGPATVITYTGIHFNIGTLKITKDNFAGIFMAGLTFLIFVATVFFVHNLSKDSLRPTKLKSECDAFQNETSISSIREILRDYEVCLIIGINCSIWFVVGTFDLIIVVVGRNTLGMDMGHIGIAIFLASVLYEIFMFTCWPRFFGGAHALRGLIFCLFCGCYACVSVIFPNYVFIENTIFKIFIILTSEFLIALAGTGSEISARELVFKLTPSSSACYVDGIRSSVSMSLFLMIGFLLASPIYDIILYSGSGIILILLILTIPLYKRKDIIYSRLNYE